MEEFTVIPRCGHLDSQSAKAIHLSFKSPKTNILKDINVICITKAIQQTLAKSTDPFLDWDDSKT